MAALFEHNAAPIAPIFQDSPPRSATFSRPSHVLADCGPQWSNFTFFSSGGAAGAASSSSGGGGGAGACASWAKLACAHKTVSAVANAIPYFIIICPVSGSQSATHYAFTPRMERPSLGQFSLNWTSVRETSARPQRAWGPGRAMAGRDPGKPPRARKGMKGGPRLVWAGILRGHRNQQQQTETHIRAVYAGKSAVANSDLI